MYLTVPFICSAKTSYNQLGIWKNLPEVPTLLLGSLFDSKLPWAEDASPVQELFPPLSRLADSHLEPKCQLVWWSALEAGVMINSEW